MDIRHIPNFNNPLVWTQVNRIVKDETKLAQMDPDIKEASVTSLDQLQQVVLQLQESRQILAQENQVRTRSLVHFYTST